MKAVDVKSLKSEPETEEHQDSNAVQETAGSGAEISQPSQEIKKTHGGKRAASGMKASQKGKKKTRRREASDHFELIAVL